MAFVAIKYGSTSMFKILVHKGCNITSHDQLMLYYAIEMKRRGIVPFILKQSNIDLERASHSLSIMTADALDDYICQLVIDKYGQMAIDKLWSNITFTKSLETMLVRAKLLNYTKLIQLIKHAQTIYNEYTMDESTYGDYIFKNGGITRDCTNKTYV
jgi:hypothetical protein